MLQFSPQFRRPCVNIRELPSIRRIHRPGRNRVVGRRIHVVPPEQVGTCKRGVESPRPLPNFWSLGKPVRLSPEHDLALVPEVSAVCDKDVSFRPRPCELCRLCRAGNCGRHSMNTRCFPFAAQADSAGVAPPNDPGVRPTIKTSGPRSDLNRGSSRIGTDKSCKIGSSAIGCATGKQPRGGLRAHSQAVP